jgi:4-hydroxyacetophenone monooxygenase
MIPGAQPGDTPKESLAQQVLRRLPIAHPVALLMCTAHLTGDLDVLRRQWRPDMTVGVPDGGYSPERHEAIVEACGHALSHAREWDRAAPGYDLLARAVTWSMGSDFASYVRLLADGLSFSPRNDSGNPRRNHAAVGAHRDFRVAVIGAGESGLLLTHRLRQAGVDVIVLEKNPDIGGTWYENTYPGCRVDLTSHSYEYSSYPGCWDDYHSKQSDVLKYLKAFARQHNLYEDIEFDTEVISSRWDSARAKWVLTVRSGEDIGEVVADVQVAAVGQLNRPHIPEIEGIETFTGTALHTARWDPSLDLTGKRVGVIGSGATAVQLIPEIARSAAQVSVFARTMPWLLPTPNLRKAIPDEHRWLLENLPHYRTWYRAVEFLTTVDSPLVNVIVDPDYPPTERAVSAVNDQLRALLQLFIDAQTEDDPKLRAAAAPAGPFGATRWIADDGTWLSTLKRENVHLIREPIARASRAGLHTAADERHDLDVLVYATGFRASEFLAPMRIEGREGEDLRTLWGGDDAIAYLGACVPGFPNFFMLYGPNTSIVVHGVSAFFISECAVRYVVDAIEFLLSSESSSLEVTESALAAYQRRIDEASVRRAWGFSTVRSWYKNRAGRSTQNWPLTILEFWQRTRQVDIADFIVTPLTRLP